MKILGILISANWEFSKIHTGNRLLFIFSSVLSSNFSPTAVLNHLHCVHLCLSIKKTTTLSSAYSGWPLRTYFLFELTL